MNTALGFRVKSGWAAAVVLAGSVEAPQVLDRRVVQLCDPAIPESKQPYHASMGTLQTDEVKVERLRNVIVQSAQESVSELMKDFQSLAPSPPPGAPRHSPQGRVQQIHRANLVVGSNIDPSRIGNPHVRAHALEGRLFRTVLEDALLSHGLQCSIIVERDIYERAAGELKRSEKSLKRSLTQLGRSLEGPWRADDKLACLAAWLALME